MATSSKEIIALIEKDFPLNKELTVSNGSDLDIKSQRTVLNQFIIGVAKNDPLGIGCDRYEHKIRNDDLKDISADVYFRAWTFRGEEEDQLRISLMELSDHFEAELNIDKMINRLKDGKRDIDPFHIVITIIQYSIISVK